MRIRSACPQDAGALLAIYRPYVEKTAVTFEYVPPSEAEFAARIESVLQKYPYLVLEDAEKIEGYAYAGPLKGRAAYDWSAETSIYVRTDAHGKGYGRVLYEALEAGLKAMGIRNLYACIAFTEQEDEFLSQASPRFHQHMGFSRCGLFRRCAHKFGRWYDMIWMEKWIGGHEDTPPPVRWTV